jgi:hypothetical protein
VTQKKITLHLNFKGPLAYLDLSLHRALTFVGIGLTTAPDAPPERAIPDGPILDTPISFGFRGFETWTKTRACSEYRTWLLAQGFRDACEAAKSFLDGCYKLVAAVIQA